MTCTTHIPVLDLSPEIEALWDELQSAMASVLRSGNFILGAQGRAFEQEVATYLDVRHAIGCNSGTDALVIGLRALGIERGDEVITSAFTFTATAGAILRVGANPVFADIDPTSFNIDPQDIERAITPRTRALIPVHLFGHAVDMGPITELAKQHDLKVLEDAAQGFGGKYDGKMLGTIGDVGAYSFYPTKNLGAFGDGGLIVTNDDQLAEQARLLCVHGAKKKHLSTVLGYNSRLDELQAAILRVKLPHVDRWNQKRQQVAVAYDEQLKTVPWLQTPSCAPYAEHVYHQYTIRISDRDRDDLQNRLSNGGVGTSVFYAKPLHNTPLAVGDPRPLPQVELAARQVLSLPIFPSLPIEATQQVAALLRGL